MGLDVGAVLPDTSEPQQGAFIIVHLSRIEKMIFSQCAISQNENITFKKFFLNCRYQLHSKAL